MYLGTTVLGCSASYWFVGIFHIRRRGGTRRGSVIPVTAQKQDMAAIGCRWTKALAQPFGSVLWISATAPTTVVPKATSWPSKPILIMICLWSEGKTLKNNRHEKIDQWIENIPWLQQRTSPFPTIWILWIINQTTNSKERSKSER